MPLQKFLVLYSRTKESASYDNLYAKDMQDAKDFIKENPDVFPNVIAVKEVDTYTISFHELDCISTNDTFGTLSSSGNTLDELKANSKVEFINTDGENVAPTVYWEELEKKEQKDVAKVVEELYNEQYEEINGED